MMGKDTISDEVRALLQIRRETLAALKALDGNTWKGASGELHYQYKEMPNWIELDAGADLRAAHRAFVQIFEPYFARMKDVNATVSYDIGNIQVGFFDTNEEIRSALDDPAFGSDQT
jgi:hypothetical protein